MVIKNLSGNIKNNPLLINIFYVAQYFRLVYPALFIFLVFLIFFRLLLYNRNSPFLIEWAAGYFDHLIAVPLVGVISAVLVLECFFPPQNTYLTILYLFICPRVF